MKTMLLAATLLVVATSASAQVQAQVTPDFAGSVVFGGPFVGTVNVGQPSFGTASAGGMSMTILMDFEKMSPRLWGMMWGAEDLAASLGASRNRTDGRFHSPFMLARDLCLIAAAAAGVVPIDTIATDINDLDALKAESIAARQDGFLAKAVIHPKHVDVVNAAFMPTDEEIAWSERVVAAFAGNPSGVAKMDGMMLDKPHLRTAEKILAMRRR